MTLASHRADDDKTTAPGTGIPVPVVNFDVSTSGIVSVNSVDLWRTNEARQQVEALRNIRRSIDSQTTKKSR